MKRRSYSRKHRVEKDLADEITAVVEDYQASLLRYAGRMLRNAVQAEDIVQDAFTKFIKHRRDSGESIRNVKAWLYRVTHNLVLDHIRRHQRHQGHHETLQADLQDAAEESPAAEYSRRDAAQRAWQMLDVLNDRERQIVMLKIVDELSYKEIAETMEVSVSNVGFILHNSMKKMAKAMRREPSP